MITFADIIDKNDNPIKQIYYLNNVSGYDQLLMDKLINNTYQHCKQNFKTFF